MPPPAGIPPFRLHPPQSLAETSQPHPKEGPLWQLAVVCLGIMLLLSPVPTWAEDEGKPTTTTFPYTLADLEALLNASPATPTPLGQTAGRHKSRVNLA